MKRTPAIHTLRRALGILGSREELAQYLQVSMADLSAWLRGEGGIGQIAPGATARASLKLAAGEYVITDVQGPGSSGPPGYAVATVTSGTSGSPLQ